MIGVLNEQLGSLSEVHIVLAVAGTSSGVLARVLRQVSVDPDPGGLPGLPALQQITNGLAAFLLVFAVACLIVGSAMWASGSASAHPAGAAKGRTVVLVGVGAAFLDGAAAALINFFHALGGTV